MHSTHIHLFLPDMMAQWCGLLIKLLRHFVLLIQHSFHSMPKPVITPWWLGRMPHVKYLSNQFHKRQLQWLTVQYLPNGLCRRQLQMMDSRTTLMSFKMRSTGKKQHALIYSAFHSICYDFIEIFLAKGYVVIVTVIFFSYYIRLFLTWFVLLIILLHGMIAYTAVCKC